MEPSCHTPPSQVTPYDYGAITPGRLMELEEEISPAITIKREEPSWTPPERQPSAVINSDVATNAEIPASRDPPPLDLSASRQGRESYIHPLPAPGSAEGNSTDSISLGISQLTLPNFTEEESTTSAHQGSTLPNEHQRQPNQPNDPNLLQMASHQVPVEHYVLYNRADLPAQIFGRMSFSERALPTGVAVLDPANWQGTEFTEAEIALFLLGEARGRDPILWEKMRTAGAPYGLIAHQILRNQ